MKEMAQALLLATKALDMVVKIKDTDAVQNKLKNDYITTKEISSLAFGLALRCGRLITTKHIDFTAASFEQKHHPSRDADGYPLHGFD